MVDRLAALQRRLHALPRRRVARGRSTPPGGTPLGSRASGSSRPRKTPSFTNALARVESLLPSLEAGPAVPCHGDFHPLNVLVAGRTATVIDWTDAALGDRHGDVARTACSSTSGLPAPRRTEPRRPRLGGPQGWPSKRYLRTYRRSAPIDPVRIRRWEAVHLLHGWAQILEAHDRGGELADRVPLDLSTWVRTRFEAALASGPAAVVCSVAP